MRSRGWLTQLNVSEILQLQNSFSGMDHLYLYIDPIMSLSCLSDREFHFISHKHIFTTRKINSNVWYKVLWFLCNLMGKLPFSGFFNICCLFCSQFQVPRRIGVINCARLTVSRLRKTNDVQVVILCHTSEWCSCMYVHLDLGDALEGPFLNDF